MALGLRQVAKKAGVSMATASRVFNDSPLVTAETRDKVLRASREVGYTPNAMARALATGRTRNIGYLVSAKTTLGLANTYYATLMSGVQDACRRRGYQCIVSAYDLSSVQEMVVPSKLKSRSVDAVFLTGTIESGVIQTLVDCGIPFLVTGHEEDCPPDQAICVGQDAPILGYLDLLQHFVDLGHSRIAIVRSGDRRGRMKVEEALRRFGERQKPDGIRIRVLESDWEENQFDVGFHAGRTWRDEPEFPTAVLSNDQWVLGFLRGLGDTGGRCPEDVSVASGGDTPLCHWCKPQITAFGHPLFENASSATELLIDFVEGRLGWREASTRAQSAWKVGPLIARESTGPAPDKQSGT
jgi:LacI family transcriptional regulator